jgi:DNA-binding NarL/FixJ family response regulator
MAIRILLADDHMVVRQGLRRILEAHPDFEIVAETASGMEAFKLAGEHKPDVAVLDIGMRELSGIDATSRIARYSPKTAVLILSMHSDERYVVAAIQAGARGYLIKDCVEEEIVLAVQNLYVGRSFFSPVLVKALLERSISTPRTGQECRDASLSERERQIYQLLREGHDDREIAARLRLSMYTVQTSRVEIMKKLDLRGAAELVLRSRSVEWGTA